MTDVRNKRTIVRNMGTRRKTAIDWLFPQVRRKVLALLLMHPDQRWYLRDIARRTGCALGNVTRELRGLAEAEIVTTTRDGNRRYYQANPASPLFPELADLIRKTVGLAEVLRDALVPLGDRVAAAFIYGSQASQDAKAASDVDLLVIGTATFAEVVSAVGPLQERLGREINPTVYPPGEFLRKVQEGHHFLRTVLKARKLFLIGGERDLRRLAEKGSPPDAP